MERKAQHQEGTEPSRPRRKSGTNRQPLAEIVQADPERDVSGKRKPGRRTASPPDRHQQEEAAQARQHHHDRPLEDRGRLAGKFERFCTRIDKQEAEQADRQ
ncbi:hypothetical protein D9M72_558040 [compost metagenome]